MNLFIVVVVGNQGKIFVLKMSFIGNARRIDTVDKSKVFASLLSIFTMLFFFFLFPNFLIGDVIVFKPQKI